MPIWAGNNSDERSEPYDGCLIVMNIGEDIEHTLTAEQRAITKEEIDRAHAAGWLVLYVFDSFEGVSKPPSFVENVEDMDLPTLAQSIFGTQTLKFEYKFSKIHQEFSGLVGKIFSGYGICSRFRFTRRASRVFGFAMIDENKVFIPPIDA